LVQLRRAGADQVTFAVGPAADWARVPKYSQAATAEIQKLRKFNMLRSSLRPSGALGLLTIVLLVTGCASPGRLSDEQSAQLIERVEARWAALEANDYDLAYTFMSPAYRDVFSAEMYRNQFSYMVARELTSVEILNYDAPAAVASVAVGVMSRPVKQTSAASAAIGAVPVVSVEQWIFRNKNWWYSVNR
jgi:hypothetical protein